MPDFPTTRFTEAGATDAELNQLLSEFDRSDVAVQESMTGYFTSIAGADITEYLDRLREADHFSVTEDTDEPEPLVPDSDPVAASGTTAEAGDTQAPPPTTEDAPATT